MQQLEKTNHILQKTSCEHLTRWQQVQLARHPHRPYTLDYIRLMTKSFIALHGDRASGDDQALVGGLGNLEGQTIMFIGHQKGRNTQERQQRNFGMASPQGYRKAWRLMKLAEKFNQPIVTLIDTPGAYPGLKAEQYGQAQAIAHNLQAMLQLRVPVISIIIGEGASGGALGIAVGDRISMLAHTWCSVISPESCSSILWHSWNHKEQAAEMLQLTAQDMFNHRLIDEVIPEPIGGAHNSFEQAAAHVKQVIIRQLKELDQLSPQQRIEQRIEKFCQMGVTAASH